MPSSTRLRMRRVLNGEIWLANLNPGKGRELSKVCPVLIVQGQALLDAMHPSILIVPLATQLMEDAERCASALRHRVGWNPIPIC